MTFWQRLKFLFTNEIFNTEEVKCERCEMLEEQLAKVEYERKVLFNKVLEQAFPEKELERHIENYDNLTPIQTTRFTPWKVRQAKLEAESRKKATVPVKQATTEEIERELGIESTDQTVKTAGE